MRTWMSYMHYKIYKWYISKGENDVPLVYAFLICTFLLASNIQILSFIISILLNITVFSTSTLIGKAIYAFVIVVPPALFNYFMVFHKAAWRETFNWFRMYPEKYEKWDISTWAYAILSVVLWLTTIYGADTIRNIFHQ